MAGRASASEAYRWGMGGTQAGSVMRLQGWVDLGQGHGRYKVCPVYCSRRGPSDTFVVGSDAQVENSSWSHNAERVLEPRVT